MFFLSLFSFLGLLSAAPAKADIMVRRPISDHAYNGTWNVTSNMYAEVDDSIGSTTYDSDGTYLMVGTTAGYADFGFTAFYVPQYSTISKVTVRYTLRDDSSGANNMGGRIVVGGTVYNGTAVESPTSYATLESVWTTNPKTGSAWTIADVNGYGTNPIQYFGASSTDANPAIRLTQVYLEATYAPPPMTEFVSIVDTGNASGTDYTSLSAWEAGVRSNLTASTTRVFSATSTGLIADNSNVTLYRGGSSLGITAKVVHNASSSRQILLENISSSTYAYLIGDQWRVDSTHLVNLSSGTSTMAIAVAECRTTDGSPDSNPLYFDTGWTTSASNYVKVWTDPNENYRHHGVWDDTKYRIETYNASCIRDDYADYLVVDGLQCFAEHDIPYQHGILIVNAQDARISNNIIKATLYEGATDNYGIYNMDSQGFFWNNAVYGWTWGLMIDGGYAYNNTAYGNLYGIDGHNSLIAKNNISYGNGQNYADTFNAASTNNLSGPGTDANIPAANARNGVIVQFADEANYDLHLDSADTGARNRGTWLATDTLLALRDDVDGDSRILAASSSVDIGADESIAKIYRSVAPGKTTALATGGSSNYGNLEIEPAFLATSTTRVIDYIATFWRPLPDNVGVGDGVQYDSDNNGTIDKIAFITKRWDGAHFSVRTATGSAPVLTSVPDADWSVFRAYTTLANAEGGTTENTGVDANVRNFDTWSGGRNIATSSEQWNIACYANGIASDTVGVAVNGWTTASSSYLRIYTPTGADETGVTQRHNGKWDSTKYSLSLTGQDVVGINNSANYFRVDGLQLKITAIVAAANWPGGIFNDNVDSGSGGSLVFSNNIIWGVFANGADPAAIKAYAAIATPTIEAFNNIIYGFNNGSYGQGIAVWQGDVYAYNNTAYNNRINYMNLSSGSFIVKNNISQNSPYGFDGSFSALSDYNVSDLPADAPGVHSKSSVTVSFVSTATSSEDFHLAPWDYTARNKGADLTNDLFLPISGDIDSVCGAGNGLGLKQYSPMNLDCLTRPINTLWDIGADELITKIYRSVAPDDNADNNLAALATGGSNAMSVSTSTAIFTTALPDNVGVGDVLQYDSNASGGINSGDVPAFISGRIDSTHYTVQTATGSVPRLRASTTTWSIFRAYTSLHNAVDATDAATENLAIDSNVRNFDAWTAGRNIASTSEQWNIACYANGTAADTDYADILSWNTAIENLIRIYAPYLSTEVGTSQRHQGKWDDSKYRMIRGGYGIYSEIANIYVDGLQIDTGDYAIDLLSAQSGYNYVSNNIIRNAPIALRNDYGSAAGVYAWNNIVYGGANGIYTYGAPLWTYIYNNTAYGNSENGFYNNGGFNYTYKNNISYGNADNYNDNGSSYNYNNISGPTQTDAPGFYARNAQAVAFVDEANGDFHLDARDSGARGMGRDLSDDQYLPVTRDADSQNFKSQISNFKANPNLQISNVDIGADQAAIPIYRSLAPGLTAALYSGSDEGSNLSISGSTMTLTIATPDNVGVGDVVQYDSDGNGSIDALAFISGRASSSQYTVQNREGGVPLAVTNDQDWSIFRAFTSLAEAEAGTENSGIAAAVQDFDVDRSIAGGKDIYASNQSYNFAAYANGTTADGGVVIAGWNTYPTDYIRIYAPSLSSEVGTSQRHQGRWDDAKYNIIETGGYPFIINESFVRIEGIEMKSVLSDTSWYDTMHIEPDENTPAEMHVSSNIIVGALSGTSDNDFGVLLFGSTNPAMVNAYKAYVYDNIIYGYQGASNVSAGIYGYGYWNAYVYNNTVMGSGYGIYQNYSNLIAKNNISYKNTDNYNGTFSASSTNNLSGPTLADAPGSNAQQGKAVVFADEANKDFHLASNDVNARNQGADLSSDARVPAFAGMTDDEVAVYNSGQVFPAPSSAGTIIRDVDGHLRSSSTPSGAWDIGADEGATAVYFSVGQNTSNHMSGSPTITISGGVATFSVAQTATTTGVGDLVYYNQTSISSFTSQGGTPNRMRVLTATAHNLLNNDFVYLASTNNSYYDGTYKISLVDSTHFDIVHADQGASTGFADNIAYISGKTSADQRHWSLVAQDGSPAKDKGSAVNVLSVQHAFDALYYGLTWTMWPEYLGTSDLYSNNLQLNIPCYYDSGPDTAAVDASGWITSAPNYLRIYAPFDTVGEVNQNQRHSGARAANRYRLETDTAFSPALYIGSRYVRIEGLQLKNSNANGYGGIITQFNDLNYQDSLSEVRITGVLSYENGGDGYGLEIASGKVFVDNSVFMDNVSDGILVAAYEQPIVYINNSDSVNNGGYGFHVQGWRTLNCRNCYAGNNASGDYLADTYGTLNLTTSHSADATGNVQTAFSTSAGGYFMNVTAGTENMHIGGLSALKNAGTDLSSDTVYAFSDDIDGQVRSGAWDVGADELSSQTEFVSIVDTGNASGTDYTSLSAWEAGVQTDLTAPTTQVFSGTSTGAIADNAAVYLCRSGAYQSQTATVVHLASSSQQILLEAISGSVSETSGDRWYTNNTCNSAAYFSLTDGGNGAIAVAKCRDTTGVADTNEVTIESWTTSATNYVKIWTDPNENYRHSGVWDEGKFRLELGSGRLQIGEANVHIDGLQVETSDWGIFSFCDDAAGYNYFSSNIVRGASNGIINSFGSTVGVYIWNNVVYGGEIGINTYGNGIINYIYNNTVYSNSASGFKNNNPTQVYKNNIAYNNGINYDLDVWDSASTNNLSGPRSIDTDAPGINPQNARIVHFADEANEDFHLDSADTGARNRGVWLATDTALSIIDDIDGDSRILAASSSVDIGADENIARIYRSVAPGKTTALATGGSSNYGNLEIKPAYLATSTTRVIDYIATFWRALPDNVGVGDGVQYDSDNNGTIDKIVFITKRWDGAHFSVRTATGSAPVLTSVPDADWSVFRAYTSLSNAEGGTVENTGISGNVVNFDTWSGGKNIATSSEQWNIACYANGTTADTVAVDFNGWTTSESDFIRVYTPTNLDEVGVRQRHSGRWDSGKYRLEVSGDIISLDIHEENVKIDGLQVYFSNASSDLDAIAFEAVGTANAYISNNIVKGPGTSSLEPWGIVAAGGTGLIYVSNNIVYDFYNASAHASGIGTAGGATVYIYNNTEYNCFHGLLTIDANTVNIVKNNIAYNNVDNYYNSAGTFSTFSSNNLSGPSQSDAPGSNSQQMSTVIFADAVNRDFHLAPGDYAARNKGADLTNDLYLPINSDIDSAMPSVGNKNFCSLQDEQCLTRPRGTMWDIGADELITKIFRSVAPGVAGSSSIPYIASGTSNQMSVSTSTASFTTALPDNVGVGDVLQYDSNASGGINAGDVPAFITERIDSTHYALQTATGTKALSRASTTTWTIFRAYTSLFKAEEGTENAAINGNLVNFDSWSGGRDIASTSEQWNIAAYGNGTSSDVVAVEIDGWNTAPQNYIKVYTPYLSTEVGVSQRHQGVYDSGKYRLEKENFSDTVIALTSNYVNIEGLQIQITNNNANGAIGVSSFSLGSNISSSIIKGVLSGTSNYNFGISTGGTGNKNIYNNIIYGFYVSGNANRGVYLIGTESDNIYNNTIYNCNIGINGNFSGTVMRIKNNLVQNSDEDYSANSGSSFSPDSTNNLSSGDSTVSFIDTINKDFHLSFSDTDARGFGKDLSKDQFLPITKDIDGQSVKFPISNFQFPTSISNVDIGADQAAVPIFRSLAPGLTTALDTGSADGNRLTIASGTNVMALATATPDNVGVGDIVQYDSDGNGSVDAVAFISGRASSSRYTVQNREGGAPLAVTNDTDWSIFRSFASLSNAEAGTENSGVAAAVQDFDVDRSIAGGKDIYASNQIYNFAAYANGTASDTATALIDGWATYPTDYIRVYTPFQASEVGTSQRHQGKWDFTKYKMDVNDMGVFDKEQYFRVDGLQIRTSLSNMSWTDGINYSPPEFTGEFQASNNIIRLILSGTSDSDSGIRFGYLDGGKRVAKAWNNIVYDAVNGAYSGNMAFYPHWGNDIYLYNNTAYNSYYGFYGLYDPLENVTYAKNNLSYNNTINYGGTFSASSTNNLSGPSLSGAPGTNPQNAKTVLFVDAANRDLHLSPLDTSAVDHGASLSADPYFPISTDIDGQARGNTWDIGADEAGVSVFYSVGQNTTNHMTGTPKVTISAGIATFDTGQTAVNMGVGDKVTYNGADAAFITGKVSASQWTVQTAAGNLPADISGSTVVSITHAFASLEAAVDATAGSGAFDASHLNTKNLATGGIQLNIPCYYDDGPDTVPVKVDGWVTATSSYIRIYTPTDTATEVNQRQRHSGKWDNLKYSVQVTDTYSIDVRISYLKIDGIQASVSNPTGNAEHIVTYENFGFSASSRQELSNSILKGHGNEAYSQFGIAANATYLNLYVSDSIIYDIPVAGTNDSGMNLSGYLGGNYIYNTTVIGGYYGIANAGSGLVIAKNNITQNCTDCYFGNFNASSDYNISSVAGDTTGGAHDKGTTTVQFIDSANKDFHLSALDTAARNAGTNLATDTALAITQDIDGQSRPVSGSVQAWDIGADEAATAIFYSVGQDGTTDRKVASNISIASSGLATFSVAQTGNIGVGDAVGFGTPTTTVYIVSKVDTSHWYVESASGTVASTSNKTVGAIKRAFSSLSGAVSGAPALLGTSDLLAGNYQLNFPCYYDTGADPGAVEIYGWNTASGNFIKIYTPNNTVSEANVSQRHSGTWDNSKFRIEDPSDAIGIGESNVWLDGLQVKFSDNSSDSGIYIGSDNTDYVMISNNIVDGSGTGSFGIRGIWENTSKIKMWNNLIYDTDNAFYGFFAGSSYIYNNTAVNANTNAFWIFSGIGATVVNNIAQNSGAGFVSNSGNFDADDDYNISNQNDAPGTHSKNLASVAFADAAGKNFHLSAIDSSAIDAGTSLASNPYLSFTTDIDGQTRSGTWDIGADETVSVIPIYYSVGQNTLNHATGSPNITISGGVATFSVAQTSTTTGVGDKVTYNTSDVAYITGKTSTSVWTVRTALGAVPADISNSAVVSITHAFASLEGAVDATTGSGAFDATHLNTKDLTSGNFQLNIACYYDTASDTTAVVVDGWTTSATNYIRIYTPYSISSEVNQTQRHSGKWDDSKFRIETSVGIYSTADYITIEGLQIKSTWTGIQIASSGTASLSEVKINDNIIQGNSPGASSNGIGNFYASSTLVMKAWNNIIYNYLNGGTTMYGIGLNKGISYIYNNTVYNSYYGIMDNTGVAVLKNNISYNNTDNYGGSSSGNSTNNLSGPSQSDAPGSNQRNARTVMFVNAAIGDFHLANNDASARNQGIGLNLDQYFPVTLDIDGDYRPADSVSWDIGADEATGVVMEFKRGVNFKRGVIIK